MYKVLDLFSGIGGFSLGLERTGGFKTIAFCEIDPFCQKVLKKHWPDVPIYPDIRELNGREITADVICGGFPCQDISIAKQGAKGLRGSRSGLWSEYKRIIKEVGACYVIIENVTALLSRGLVTVLRDINEIGLDAEWHVISVASVGSIQRRQRTWIIAYPPSKREQGLLEGVNFGAAGQGWACRQEDLPEVYAHPLGGNSWPQPIIRGGDDRPADWVDRIRSLGNAVVPQIVEVIGNAIIEAEELDKIYRAVEWSTGLKLNEFGRYDFW